MRSARVFGRTTTFDTPILQEALIAKILYVTTYSATDPTKATLPFILSVGAVNGGHTPQIALLADAPLLAKDAIAAQIKGRRLSTADRAVGQADGSRRARLCLRTLQ
jgi:hypothetical protein